jgi:tetratricopeptide (TPR) repeat protein
MNASSAVEDVFLAALKRDGEAERAAYLMEACGDDTDLRRRVDRLLAAHARVGNFLEQPALELAGPTDQEPGTGPAAGPDDPSPVPEAPGARIGPYRLVRKLGEGGMGVVYEAEQAEPVRRLVALKVVKPGMDSAQVLSRFEAERQALALMDHPNIARILDAGTTDRGSPFFVMELVRGTPITRYCDEHHMGLRERLGLFVAVCRAVQHAHQKGVIHRDLKPSNIPVTVVDGRPVPKVIDFGTAKAVGPRLTERTLFTGFGALVGTPEYMSPEQAGLGSADVDTRSDVYSLGVLLYELLTGTTPLGRQRLRQAPFDEVLRIIREEVPPRPSTRRSGPEAGRLRGDLDWIALRCLEKDRARRYETAAGLARDVERFLADEPVEAGPPSPAYRLRKFARRHRTALAVAGAFLVLLVAAVAVSTREAVRAHLAEQEARDGQDAAERARRRAVAAAEDARAARDEAERQRQQAEAVAGFLTRVFRSPDPGRDGRRVKVVELLDGAADRLDRDVRDPVTQARLLGALGETYHGLGLPAKAVELHARALRLLHKALGPDHVLTLGLANSLGRAYLDAGRVADALPLLEENLKRTRTKFGPDDANTLAVRNNLALAYQAAGWAGDAVPLYEETLRRQRARLGADHPDTLTSMNNLAQAYRAAGRPREGLRLLEETLPREKARLGPDDVRTLATMNNLGRAYLAVDDPARARALLEEALRRARDKLGPDHPNTVRALNNLALARLEGGDADAARPLLEQAVALARDRLGADHPTTLDAMNDLARYYQGAGRLAEAVKLFATVLTRRQARRGPDHPETLTAVNNLAGAYRAAGKVPEAVALFEKALQAQKAGLGPTHPETLLSMNNLGEAYLAGGQAARGLPLLEAALGGMEARLGPGHRLTITALGNLAAAYQAVGQRHKARSLSEQALRRTQDRFGPAHPKTLVAVNNLAFVCQSLGQFAEALALYRKAYEGMKARPGPTHPTTLTTLGNLAGACVAAKRWGEAERAYRELVTLERQAGRPALAGALTGLGDCLIQAGKYAAAEPPLRESLELRKGRPNSWPFLQARILLGASLLGQEKPAQAEPLLAAGYERFRDQAAQVPPEARARVREALQKVIRLYEAFGSNDQAARWRKRLAALE